MTDIDWNKLENPPPSSIQPVLNAIVTADVEELWAVTLVLASRFDLMTAEDMEVMFIEAGSSDWRQSLDANRRLCVKIVDRWRVKCEEHLG